MAEKLQADTNVERIRGKVVVRHLTPGTHASVVALVEGGAVIRIAQPADVSQATWPTRATTLRNSAHPSLVRLVGAKGADPATGAPAFVASEYIEGPLLSELLEALDGEEAARIARSLAEAVQIMHQANVPHGRIHAGQVRLRADQTPVLLDVAATWGTADFTLQSDVEALITLALALPAGPDTGVWESLKGTGATIGEVLRALDGEVTPASLTAAAAAEARAQTAPLVAPPMDLPEEPVAPQRKVVRRGAQVDRDDDSEREVDRSIEQQDAAGGEHHDSESAVSADGGSGEYHYISAPESVQVPEDSEEKEEDSETKADEQLAATEPEVATALGASWGSAVVLQAPDVEEPSEASLDVEGSSDEETPDRASSAVPGETKPDFRLLALTPPEHAEPLFVTDLESWVPPTDQALLAPLGDTLESQTLPVTPAPRSEVPVVAAVERPSFNDALVVEPDPSESPAEMHRELADALAARDALAREVASGASREQHLRTTLIMAQAEAEQASQRASDAATARQSIEDDLAAARDALSASEAARAHAEQRAADLSAELEGAETKAVHLAAAEAAAAQYDIQLSELNAEVVTLRTRAASAEADAQAKEAQIAALNDDLTARARELIKLRNERTADTAAQTASPSERDIAESAKSDLVLVRGELALAQDRIVALTSEVSSLTARLEDAQSADVVSRLGRAEASAEVAVQEKEDLLAELSALRSLTVDMARRLAATTGETSERVSEMDDRQDARIQELTAENVRLSATVESLRGALQEANADQYPREVRRGQILPVSAEPATPVVAVIDPQTGPAGPGLVAALREVENAQRRISTVEA